MDPPGANHRLTSIRQRPEGPKQAFSYITRINGYLLLHTTMVRVGQEGPVPPNISVSKYFTIKKKRRYLLRTDRWKLKYKVIHVMEM